MTRPALLLLAGLLIGIWAVSLLGFVFTSLQGAFGLVPRSLGHLPGVLTMPLLHQDFAHLIANSVPLAVLGALLALQGATYLRRALLVVVVLGGLLLWLFGRQGVHIGASGLVFGLFGLLLGRAWFTRSPRSLVIALGVMFFYGGLLWGIVPSRGPVSWEGHLSGLIAGVLGARALAERR